jgi:1,4-dihydroxy-2-naphthoate octaprenyltransferase
MIKDLIAHLRLPFSLFLLPVFLFAIAFLDGAYWGGVCLLFLVLHLLVYPASNGYNSYMDRDEGSIGGLKSPPKVPKQLFAVTVWMDALALLLTFSCLHPAVGWLLVAYIAASRAYSYRGIRLKQYPWIGFLTVAVFQGAVVYAMAVLTATQELPFTRQHAQGMLIALLLIGAGYPLTQVYQHEQDRRDGVTTLSMRLGIRGTFVFSASLFACLGALLVAHIVHYGHFPRDIYLAGATFVPVGGFFLYWTWQCFQDPAAASYENAMRMNLLGGICLNLLFLMRFILNLPFV